MVVENGKVLPRDPYYREYYWDLRKVAWNCARCSNCKWIDSWEVRDARFAKVCPSSQYYLYDAYSCQGRMDLALALIDGTLKYDDSPALLDIFHRCNMCGGCDAMCKRVQDMEPLRVIQEMRTRLAGDGQLNPLHMPALESLRQEDNLLQGRKQDRGRWADGLGLKDLAHEKAPVVFHAGCRYSFDESLWKVPRTIAGLLKRTGVDFGILGAAETCCGGRAEEMGFAGELVKYAESNRDAWHAAGVKTVVTACSDGYYTFKRRYPALGIEFEALHIIEYLAKLLAEGRLALTHKVPLKVTWHDPCHLGRRLAQAPGHYRPGEPIMGLYEEPRALLRAVPGLELVEMCRIKEYAWCCGAGGGVAEAYPDFNAFTAAQRVAEAEATGAEAIVTACGWCERNFNDAIASSGSRLKVMDITELLALAAGEER
jgi:Fe-S oxidoreductase